MRSSRGGSATARRIIDASVLVLHHFPSEGSPGAAGSPEESPGKNKTENGDINSRGYTMCCSKSGKAMIVRNCPIQFWIKLSARHVEPHSPWKGRPRCLPTSFFNHILVVTHLPENARLLVYHNLPSPHQKARPMWTSSQVPTLCVPDPFISSRIDRAD
jgi:hypothetical protein